MVVLDAISRLLLWVLSLLILIPVGLFIQKFMPQYRFAMGIMYLKFFCRVVTNSTVEVRGDISKEKPTLFVANHSSYLDIPILGSAIKGSFVSKKEIESWPVIGLLAKLQNTVFIKRERGDAGKHSNTLISRVQDGDNLMIFAEGTSSYSNRVYPFKSSLFSIANQRVKYEGQESFLKVQPVSICFNKLNEETVCYADRRYYSWVGDEYFIPHLYQFIKAGKKNVLVEFHPVVSMDEFKDRKEMANYCQGVVAHGVSEKIAGR